MASNTIVFIVEGDFSEYYLIDNFDVASIKSKTRTLGNLKGGYEYGLSLNDKENYYRKTVKDKKN